MGQCYTAGDFKKYFNENMQDLGLPVPSTLFDTYNTALSTASTMVGTLATLGKGATMAELVGATVGLEKLAVAASIGASAYTGAAIGSIAVAAGRSLGCGSRMSDLFVMARQNKLEFDGLAAFYANNPQVIQKNHPGRARFGMQARIAPANFSYA